MGAAGPFIGVSQIHYSWFPTWQLPRRVLVVVDIWQNGEEEENYAVMGSNISTLVSCSAFSVIDLYAEVNLGFQRYKI